MSGPAAISGDGRSILLLGNYRPGLALARRFAEDGYRVIVGSEGCEGGCEHSRFVEEIWEQSVGPDQGEAFVQSLAGFCATRPELAAVFPVSEDYVRLLARPEHQAALGDLPPLIMVAPALVDACLDKLGMMTLAQKAGVPTAAFAQVDDPAAYTAALDRLGVPLVIRPAHSSNRIDGRKAVIVDDRSEADALTIDWATQKQGLILQRKAEGVRHNFYFAAYRGQLIRCLHAVITRTDRVDDTGLAVEGVTIAPDPGIRGQTEALVAALDYHGIGCAQFLVDSTSGTTSFLEINPRIAGNHAVPDYAGLDLGGFLLDIGLGRTPDLTPVTGMAGIRYVWTSGDMLAAKESWLRGEISGAAALLWLGRVVIAGIWANVHIVFSWSDPNPGLRALWAVLPRLNRWQKPKDRADKNWTEDAGPLAARRMQS
ncbi:MAG: hypothetical protein AAGL24_25640 [Pseudomonadota bacterium]